MKVLVTVKEALEVADDFEIEGSQIDERYLEYDLNEWDEYAVEEAVQLKEEAGDDVEVVSATIGPERSEETIRMVLAKGVDRAIRVWNESLASQDFLDVRTKAAIFQAVVAQENPDLILTGVQADDDAWASTGVALAALTDFAWSAVVIDMELDAGEEIVHVRRELEGGVEELVDIQLPAVLTIQTGINEPRYASLRGIRQAQQKEIEVFSLDDLGMNESDVVSQLNLRSLAVPTSESETQYFDGSPTEQATQLVDVLREKGVGIE